jgi:uncharacterized iron-regulated membrane protein
MQIWAQWLKQPQTLWVRRAIFQVHLWTGLAIGLYLVMLSITGAALVYRVELERSFEVVRPAFEPNRARLSQEEMKAAAERLYPGWEVTRVGTRITRRNPTLEVWVERNGEKKERLFNPYTGEDLGDAIPQKVKALNWVAELHDELLLGQTGRKINAAGSGVVTLLVISGLIVWWPGVRNWRRSLGVKRGTNWIRFNWDLHSAIGFWSFLLLALWGLSGIYLAYPDPFSAFVDRISDPDAILGQRPGDIVLAWMSRLHFGRFRNARYLQAFWVPLGLIPAVMFVTGFLMWWNRVLRKRKVEKAA